MYRFLINKSNLNETFIFNDNHKNNDCGCCLNFEKFVKFEFVDRYIKKKLNLVKIDGNDKISSDF
jgi:hypothetical protein